MARHFIRPDEADPREDKLPKWAQDKLRNLRNNIDTLTHAVEEVPLTDDTLVVTGRYGSIPRPVPVTPHENVTFFTRMYDGPDHFDVRTDGDDLLIYASDTIDMHQQSGNVVRVKFQRGSLADAHAERKEALAKGWTAEDIRLDRHLGHIPTKADYERNHKVVARNTHTGELLTQADLEARTATQALSQAGLIEAVRQ